MKMTGGNTSETKDAGENSLSAICKASSMNTKGVYFSISNGVNKSQAITDIHVHTDMTLCALYASP